MLVNGLLQLICRHQIVFSADSLIWIFVANNCFFLLLSFVFMCFFPCCLRNDKDNGTLSSRKRHCRRINTGGALVPALHFDCLVSWQSDYELLVFASAAFTNCWGKACTGWGANEVEIVHFGDEQPERGASSAHRGRYLATRCHIAKTKSRLRFFSPSLTFIFTHSSVCLIPLFSLWLVKG